MKPLMPFFLVLLLTVSLHGYIKDSTGVPMRDSVYLGTDIYFPTSSNPPWPVLVQRTPYDRYWDSNLLYYITDIMGYALVVQNLRGFGDSQGEPTVFFTDGWGNLRDGYDAIEWVAGQVWSNSLIGMIGSSAHGITQYCAAGARPPHLTCCAPMAAAPSMYHYGAFTGGEFRKALVETWLTGLGKPWLIDSVANHPRYDPLWMTTDLSSRWDSVQCPIFHLSGWYDIFTDGQLEAFGALQARQRNQKLFVGPWGHSSWNSQYQGDLVYPDNAVMGDLEFWSMVFSWYDHWLKDTTVATGPSVTFYLMGDCDSPDTTIANHWVEADTWPLPGVSDGRLYFRSGGNLDTVPPPPPLAYDSFAYDPMDPCTTYGGREFIGLTHGYGPIAQNPIEDRTDVMTYTTPALVEPLVVIGKIRCALYASTDGYDTDWTIRITDVYPDGRSILVTDNILKARHRHGFDQEDSLFPDQPDTFFIDAWSTAQVWGIGHRLRVIVSSSNYPRYEYNPNTGAPFMRNDPVTRVARQRIFRTAGMPSHVILPILPSGAPVAEDQRRLRPQFPATSLAVDPPSPILRFRITSGLTSVPITVFDRAGRRQWHCDQGRGEMSVSGLPAGVYFIAIEDRGRSIVSKVLVIK